MPKTDAKQALSAPTSHQQAVVSPRRWATTCREFVLFLLGVTVAMLSIVSPLLLVVLLDAPTIDPTEVAWDYSWRTKTILNAGGMGLVYWEGAECVVDLYATFTPLGTYQGKSVGRYTTRASWWGWWQCPTGTLIELTPDESPAWVEEITRKKAQEAAQAAELRALSEQARQKDTP